MWARLSLMMASKFLILRVWTVPGLLVPVGLEGGGVLLATLDGEVADVDEEVADVVTEVASVGREVVRVVTEVAGVG